MTSDADMDAAFERTGINAKVAAVPADAAMALGRVVLKAAYASAQIRKPMSFTRGNTEHPEWVMRVTVEVKKR